ncbi:hypothetical protein [Streptomyces vilmorinianum]|uniref:hypothetical protein n=1 Tax=Streptomyces vilmorinianum TaxID=3051092 RepID=UPI0010FB67A3|nr:hypothetical protein [Streptomyces vilmorinianum]
MAATDRIAVRSNTLNHPITAVRTGLTSWLLRHSRWASDVYFERLRTSLPLVDPDRHALESPAVENVFARLAIDHPESVTPSVGGTPARRADRETRLVAVCDQWFRDAHGPEHSWSPRTLAAYHLLLDSVHECFNAPDGES